jgi:hypothetical protein
LYEYELSVSPIGVAPLPYASNAGLAKNTQEHILPQEHRDGGWWQSHWPSPTEADAFKHRLGNLVLTSDNNALSRKSIGGKLNAPATTYCYNFATATNSEKRIHLFTDGVTWRPENILKREVELLEFAATRWHLPCVGDAGTYDFPNDFQLVSPAPMLLGSDGCPDMAVDAASGLDDSENSSATDDGESVD